MTRTLALLDTVSADAPPRSGADRSQITVARVTGTSGSLVGVSVLGCPPVMLPATSGTSWSGVSTAYVLLDPTTGRPVHVLGPAPAPKAGLPPAPSASRPVAVTRTVTIPAAFASTWVVSSSGAAWGGWDQAGAGESALWQGSRNGTRLAGLAHWGQAVPALNATQILRATVQLNPATPATVTLTLAPAVYTESGPTRMGTASVSQTLTGQPLPCDVTSLATALIGGAGLACVGSGYGAVGGRGDGMSLTLTYTTTE